MGFSPLLPSLSRLLHLDPPEPRAGGFRARRRLTHNLLKRALWTYYTTQVEEGGFSRAAKPFRDTHT